MDPTMHTTITIVAQMPGTVSAKKSRAPFVPSIARYAPPSAAARQTTTAA
jgi:hypothetical protein